MFGWTKDVVDSIFFIATHDRRYLEQIAHQNYTDEAKEIFTFEIFFKYLLSRSKYFWVVAVLSGANFPAQERLQKIWTFSVHTIKCCQLFVYCPLEMVEMVEMENIQTIADSVTFLDTSNWAELRLWETFAECWAGDNRSVSPYLLSLFIFLVLTLSFVNSAHTTHC